MKKKGVAIIALAVVFLFFLSSYTASLTFTFKTPVNSVANRTIETYSDAFFDYELIRYPSRAEIADPRKFSEEFSIGFNLDPWNLDFGLIPGNGSFSKRFINLTNNGNDAKVVLATYGNISDMISFSSNNFMLKKSAKSSVDVSFNTGRFLEGSFGGEIDVIIQKPKYVFIRWFLA